MVLIRARREPAEQASVAGAAPVAIDAVRALLRGLNREQRSAITHTGGPALVLAGPGSGKTEVVTRRVAWLIATKRARPREILALTFTDNAAQEMQARVDVLVPYGQADAAIHTFHAFGDRLLREHAFELGLPSDVRLLSRRELIFLLRSHLFELGLQRYLPLGDPGRFLGALVDLFARAKDEDIRPQDLAGHAAALQRDAARSSDPQAQLDLGAARTELARAFDAYCRLLGSKGIIDHSDQVSLALRLLRDRPAVRAAIGARYRYLVVDELQDTNRTQLELVLALAGQRANVLAVGDPDQGIYAFRGARLSNVERFAAALPDVRRIELRRNYRSLAPIIAGARRVVASADDGLPRAGQVAQRRAKGRPLRHVAFATPEAEADGIAADIERRIAGGSEAREIAVLVRSNGEAAEMARAIRARGVPVETGARAALLDNPAARALLAFIRVVADPHDSLELFRLAAAEPYRLGGAELGQLLSGARRRNRSLWDVLGEAVTNGDDRLDQRSLESARALVRHVSAAVERSATATSGAVVYAYLNDSGWLRRAAQAAGEQAVADARALAQMCGVIRSRAALLTEDRIQFLAPILEINEPDDDHDDGDPSASNAVSVLTVHRAKGLEFPIVYVAGLVDGRFPVRARPATLSLPAELLGHADDDDQLLAEERRLFYVALTRARDEVVLTSHMAGPRGRGSRRPSLFIAEALGADAQAAAVPAAAEQPLAIAQLLTPPAARPAKASRESLTLSYSQIDDYLTCPERYRLRYEIGIPTPAHHLLSYGTAVHQAIASFHAAQADGRALSDVELGEELARAWRPEGFLSREHEEARFAAGKAALGRFREQQVGSGVVPAAVERPFSFRLGPDEIRGRIDRIDHVRGGAVITDYKSSDVDDQQRADVKARDSLQLQVYAMAHLAETGELPQRVQLHFVESGVVGSAVPDEKRLERARERLTTAADAIRAESFTPKPSAFACGYCPFRTICTSSVARAA